jgi:hypothetical protein
MNTHYFTYLLAHVDAWTYQVYPVVLSINFLCRSGESIFVFDMQVMDQPSFFNQWYLLEKYTEQRIAVAFVKGRNGCGPDTAVAGEK